MKILDKNWGRSKGGKKSVEARIEKWGVEGFNKQLLEASLASGGFLNWHKTMKRNQPKMYSEIQRKRWKNYIEIINRDPKFHQRKTKTIIERFGKDFFTKIGLKGAESGKVNEIERAVIHINKKLFPSIKFKTHMTLYDVNLDCVYIKKQKIIAVEEILGSRKNRSVTFFELANILEKKRVLEKNGLKVPFFLTTRFKTPYQRYFHCDGCLWMIDNDIIPIFTDLEWSIKTKQEIIEKNSYDLKNIDNFCRSIIQKNKSRMKSGVKIEINRKFDSFEQSVDNILKKNGIKTGGKRALRTVYNTYIVSDNFMKEKNTAIFISKRHIGSILGNCLIAKLLLVSPVKTIGIIISPKREIKRKIVKKLIDLYVDKFYYNLKEFEKDLEGR